MSEATQAGSGGWRLDLPKVLGEVERYAHADLRLDLHNPRSPGEAFADENDALAYLVQHADVAELVASIRAEGWLDFEPLIVDLNDDTVYEGNRRLAALKLISSAAAREQVGFALPELADAKEPPAEVRVLWVDGRDAARAFIGFKHINGPLKWDALAKAKFAADWISSPGAELAKVARALGDAHSTVERLVNGIRVLHQATANGFDPSPEATGRARFPFSHLYTAVARPNVRAYLGLDPNLVLLDANPVPAEQLPRLSQLMQWLFGQDNKPAVVRTQNPDLNRLVDVLGNERSVAMLVATNSLSSAHEVVEEKGGRFREAIGRTAAGLDDASRLIRNYTGDPEDLATANQLVRGTRLLRDQMQRIADGGALDEDDAPQAAGAGPAPEVGVPGGDGAPRAG
jgi:hypothetical protein